MTSRLELHTAAGDWPCPSLHELAAARARDLAGAPFLVEGTVRLTFGELHRRAAALAAGLARLGIGAGDVVSWQLPSWWEAAVLAVAVDRLGAVNNPILAIYREREVSFIARQAGSRVLVVPGVFRSFDHRELARTVRHAAPALEHVVVARDEPAAGTLGFEDLLADTTAAPPPVAPDPHRAAFLFYTSGTTADPKGVVHSASTLGSFARINAELTGMRPGEVSLLQFPLAHIGGIGAFLFGPLRLGFRVVYLDQWSPAAALRLIEEEGVTNAGGPPPILQGILASPEFRPERVRTLRVSASGAADIAPELIREARRRLGVVSFRSYGLTECPMVTSGRADDPEERCAETDGRPSPGCRVRVVNDDGEPVPAGVEGEIEVFGPQLCAGYLDPALAVAAFTADGYLRTGDLGVLDAQGYLTVTGRKKDIIIRKGENLSARAIEDVLHEHPDIVEAAVIGVPDAASGERVCACVVLRPGAPALDLTALKAFMEGKKVMRQKIPEQLEVLPCLPRNAMGKVLKSELRRRFGPDPSGR